MAANKRPLVNSEPVSEFGAALPADADFAAPEIDLMHVPGFSELRQRRDREMAEYVAGTRHGKDVSTLPVNVRWVAITKPSAGRDEPHSVKLMKAANSGYRPVTDKMVGKHPWITKLPPGAKVLPDGMIVNAAGDLALHYCDAPQAALNQLRKDRRANAIVDGVGTNLGDGAEGLKVAAGGDFAPTVDRTTAP